MLSETSAARPSMWPVIATLTCVAAVFLVVASSYIKYYAIPLSSAAGIYGCFLLLLGYVITLAMSAGRAMIETIVRGRYKTAAVLSLLILPYLCYAAGTFDFRWQALARLVVIAAPLLILYSVFPVREQARFHWQDLLVAVWLVSIVISHSFRGIWTVPVNLDFMGRLFVVSLGVLCWTFIRPVPDLGYRIDFGRRALLAAVRNFAFFAVIAIPLGLLVGFTSWNPRWHGLPDFLMAYLEIFFFIAVLEELFFRGFLQNLLAKSLGFSWRGQLVAACIFGFFHILHAPFPNWRYVMLASIAGWYYGSAYRCGGTLLSSAFVHALVDTVWRTFFTKS